LNICYKNFVANVQKFSEVKNLPFGAMSANELTAVGVINIAQ